MRKLLIILSVMLSLLFILLIGCPTTSEENNTDDSNTTSKVSTKIVPSKFMVDVPDSIKNDSNPGVPDPRKSGTGSYAREQIAMTVEEMQTKVKDAAFNFAFIDEVVKDLIVSDTKHENMKIIITQELIEKIKLLAPDESTLQYVESFKNMIGQEWYLNPFYYKNSDDSDFNKLYEEVYEETTSDNYKNIIKNKFYWSDDKEKCKIVFETINEGTNDMMNNAIFRNNYTYCFSYDNTQKTSKLIYVYEQFQDDPVDNSNDYDYNNFYSITLKEDSSNSTLDGVYIIFENVTNSNGENYSYKTEGYADDNGGYLEYTMTMKIAGQIPETWKCKEAFGGDGNIVYYAWWDNSNDSWLIDNTYNDDTYVATYSDEWSEFDNYDDSMYDNSYVDEVYSNADGSIVLTMDTTPDSYFLIYGELLTQGALDYLNGDNTTPTPEEEAEVNAIIGTAYSDSTGQNLYIYLYEQTDDTSVYLYAYDWQTTSKYYIAHSNVNIQQ